MTSVTITAEETRTPVTLLVARFLLTLQIAFGLAGLAFALYLYLSSSEPLFLLFAAYAATTTALLGWLATRWSSRRTWVRWALVATPAAEIAAILVIRALDSSLTWSGIMGTNALALTFAVLLLLPSAARWFSVGRPAHS